MGIKKAAATVFLPNPRAILNVDGIKRGADLIGDTVRSISPHGKTYRVETFEDAIERLGLDESKIQRRRWELMAESRVMYLMALIALIAAAYYAITDQHLGVFAAACSWLIGATGGFCKAFRVDQIDRRELYDFPTFFRRPEGWIK